MLMLAVVGLGVMLRNLRTSVSNGMMDSSSPCTCSIHDGGLVKYEGRRYTGHRTFTREDVGTRCRYN